MQRNPHAALLASAIMCTMVAVAGSTNSVFVLPSSNVMWRTAPSATFEVPVFMPPGASSATLVVAGYKYSREYTDIADGMFALSLPVADSPDGENVNNLTLTFNDPLATTRSARIAVVLGSDSGGAAEAIVRTAGSGTRNWNTIGAKAVLPIPFGVDAVTVNGSSVDSGLYDSPGWFLFKPHTSVNDIVLAGGGSSLAEETLYGTMAGFSIIFR